MNTSASGGAAIDEGSRAGDGELTGSRRRRVGDIVQHGQGRAARFQRFKVEGDREERGLVEIEKIPGPIG
jgi:hypothetical protein